MRKKDLEIKDGDENVIMNTYNGYTLKQCKEDLIKEFYSDPKIIIEDPVNWLEYSEEMRMEELLKYHQENKIKGYSYQTSLL